MSTVPDQPSMRRSRVKFGLPFLIIALSFLGLVAYQIYLSYRTAQAVAHTSAKNLTLVLESKLNTEFAAAKRTVSAMADDIDPKAMRQEDVERYRPQLSRWLKSSIGNVSSALALRYFDVNGDRLYSTVDGEAPLNIADRAHFRKLKANPADTTFFFEVATGRITGRVSMYAAKAVRDKQGSFLGIAATAIDLTSLYEHFRRLDLGRNGMVALRRLDNGALIVRFPGPVEVDDQPAPNLPVRQAILDQGPVGAIEFSSPVDGIRRMYGYRTVGSFPFFVAVGIADDDYLAEWRRTSVLQLVGSLLFLAILAAVFSRLVAAESRRSRIEARLRESESRFRHLTELSSDWYWEQDENYRFTFISAGVNVQERGVGEHIGKTRWELPHIDTAAEVIRENDALLAARKPFKNLVIRRMGRDNTVHYAQVSGEPVFDERGQFSGYRGVGRDITERMRAETALRDAEKLLEEVEHLSRLGGWKYDCASGSMSWTDEVYRIHGVDKDYDPSNLESNIRCYAPEDANTISAAFWKAVDRGEPYDLELRMFRANGDAVWVRTTGTPLVENGKVVSVTGNILDITERKRKEDEYRTIIQASTDGFWITDTFGRILDVNESICRMLGYSREELLHMRIPQIEADESAGDVDARMREMMRAGGMVFTARHRRKNGGIIDVEVSVQYVASLGERFFVFIRDITERKQAEWAQSLMEAQLRESQKMEALGTLAGGVAHDFNNIIASIMGNVELARQDVGAEHAAQESLEEIRKASRRAKELVQQILAFGRRQQAAREVISLAPVVEESVRLLRTTLPAGVTLTLECDPNAPHVLADATQVEQVLLNLCSNAWQAIQSQARPGKIEVRLQGREQAAARARGKGSIISGETGPGLYACLTVHDNGSGMDKETMARIFEPFFTTKPVGKGTGLGLSVVHGIAKDHGAAIEVRSAPGEGATFVIYFPAVVDSASLAPEADPVRAERSRRELPQLRGEGKRVLYIDDDDSIVFLMTRLLQRQGYRVSGYTDPQEALAAARVDPSQFDLAVTDYNMPGMSGLEVASALGEICPGLPVALASGYITEELRQQAPAAGVSELIYKPNTVEELCETVARLANAEDAGNALSRAA